jgi:hypothetical protein
LRDLNGNFREGSCGLIVSGTTSTCALVSLGGTRQMMRPVGIPTPWKTDGLYSRRTDQWIQSVEHRRRAAKNPPEEMQVHGRTLDYAMPCLR